MATSKSELRAMIALALSGIKFHQQPQRPEEQVEPGRITKATKRRKVRNKLAAASRRRNRRK
jgi:hypothetical protein